MRHPCPSWPGGNVSRPDLGGHSCSDVGTPLCVCVVSQTEFHKGMRTEWTWAKYKGIQVRKYYKTTLNTGNSLSWVLSQSLCKDSETREHPNFFTVPSYSFLMDLRDKERARMCGLISWPVWPCLFLTWCILLHTQVFVILHLLYIGNKSKLRA